MLRTMLSAFGSTGAFLCIAAGSPAPTAEAQCILHQIEVSDVIATDGPCVAGVGDVNGDGIADFAGGAPEASEVRVYSGSDGSLLRTLITEHSHGALGWAVESIEDFTGDGVREIVAFEMHPSGSNRSRTIFYSGSDGSVIHAVVNSAEIDLDAQLRRIGDVDADGIEDVAVSLWSYHVGHLDVISSRTGEVLQHYEGAWGVPFGQNFTSAGDVDSDGHDDIAYTATDYDWVCHLLVRSGRNGELLRDLPMGEGDFAIVNVGDRNGDSIDDIAVGDAFDDSAGNDAGVVRVISGVDGTVLSSIFGDGPGRKFGLWIGPAGDVDGDGDTDVLVRGAPWGRNISWTAVVSIAKNRTIQEIVLPYQTALYSQADAGDIDGDGRADIILGPWDDTHHRLVTVVRGGIDQCSENATLSRVKVPNGQLLTGDLTDLESSDDSYVHTRSGFGSTLVDLHNMEMIIGATTTVDSPTNLTLTIESRIDEPLGTAQVRLRNWNTSAFDLVGTYAIHGTDQTLFVPGVDATRFVSAQGEIDVSIKQLVHVPFLALKFESFFDLVKIALD